MLTVAKRFQKFVCMEERRANLQTLPRMGPCFIPKCRNHRWLNANCHLFRSPPNLIEDWTKILSEVRPEPVYDRLKHYVCFLHFEDNFIIKSDDFVIGEEKVSLDRSRWKLKDDAIPTIFPKLPPPRGRPRKKKIMSPDRQSLKDDNSSSNKRKTPGLKNQDKNCINESNPNCIKSAQITSTVSNELRSNKKSQELNDDNLPKISSYWTLNVESNKYTKAGGHIERYNYDSRSQVHQIEENGKLLELDDIVKGWDETRLPDWFLVPENKKGEEKALHFIQFKFGEQAEIGKSIKILSNMQFEVRARKKDVMSWVRKHFCDDKLEHMESVCNLLRLFSSAYVCLGARGFKKITDCKGAYVEDDVWYSEKCDIIGESVMCVPCKLFQNNLTRKLYRCPIKKELKETRKKRELKSLHRKVNNLTKRKEVQSEVVRNLKSEVALLKRENRMFFE